MEELKQLEQSLYSHYRLLQEIIDIAFVDLFDFVDIVEVENKRGGKQQRLLLKDGIEECNGVEIKVHQDGGVSIRAPYKMKALDFLAKYTDLLGTERAENSLKQRGYDEMEMVKEVINQLGE